MTINFKSAPSKNGPDVWVTNLLAEIGETRAIQDILSGLTAANKWISSMYFYDSVGSRLFDEITRLPEYYLTRMEKELLADAAAAIAGQMEDVDIVEIGSGSCSKISILLEVVPPEAMGSVGYLPVDVSQAAGEKSIKTLQSRYPHLSIELVVADFTRQLNLIPRRQKRLFCFFGSTIGNLSREEADQFMIDLGGIMQPDEILLLGLDMVKEKNVLEAAYNDSRGITALFNLNILTVVNHIADTDFNPEQFSHLAFYNAEAARIEMHLRAGEQLMISSPHLEEPITVEQEETIHTENSHKFTREDIYRLASISGLRAERVFTNGSGWFSLVQFIKRRDG